MHIKMLKIESKFNNFKIFLIKTKTKRDRNRRRRRNNDDQYENSFSYIKKRIVRSKISNTQKCKNWNNLKNWLRNCEKYIVFDFVNFQTKKIKTNWSTSFLMTTKKNQWRNYVDVQFKKQTWKQYKNYLLTLFNNLMIRVMNTIIIIENVKQLFRQNIVAFNQYLIKL